MKLYYSDMGICLRIRVFFENQERMKTHIDPSFTPLFGLKRDQYISLKFEYKTFTCTCQGKKQEFTYREIKKVETRADGVIIYLNNGAYISIATEKLEKHNSELYDIVTLLKGRCRRVFTKSEEIAYPDDDYDGVYEAKKEPIAQFSFELSDQEISRLLWYDYLFDEKMMAYIVPIVLALLIAVIIQNIWLVAVAGFLTITAVFLTVTFLQDKDSYVKNHQGLLHAFLFDELLVIRLRDTDLELEYNSVKPMKQFFGLCRIKSGDFFVLTLPKRIVKENASFFDTLYQKI